MTTKRWAIQAAGLVLLLAFGVGCNRSPEARRDKYLARGKESLEKGDFPRAIVEFKNASQAMPKDSEPYFQMGLGFLGIRDYRSALAAFRETLQLNPHHVGAQLRIAQMKVESDDPGLMKEAEGELNALMKEAPSNRDAIDTLAIAQLKLSEGETAIGTLDRALTQSPGDLLASVLLARADLTQKNPHAAEDVLKTACRNAPKSADAPRFLGEFYISQKKFPEAEAQLRHAVALDSRNGPALLDLARLEFTEGKKEEAEQNFKKLSAMEAYKPMYGTFLFVMDRRDEAIREFERLVRENPDNRQLRTDLIFAYRSMNRGSDIDKLLDSALRKNPKDVEALIQRARVFLDRGEYGKAESDLNNVLHLEPNSPDAHYRFAKLQQARGAVRTYRQELAEALRLNPALENVRVELAQSLLADKAPKDALDLLDKAPQGQKGSAAILVTRNWALWYLGDMEAMRKGIDDGLSKRAPAAFLTQDAAWNLREKHVLPARAAAEKALNADPSSVPALTILAQTYAAEGKGPSGIQEIRGYAAKEPNSATVQIFFGDLLLSQHQIPEARAAFLKAKAADPRSLRADISLATVDAADGKVDDARKRLLAVVSTDPGNISARMMLGNLDDYKGDKRAAIEQYRKVLESNPEKADALNDLAYLLAEYGHQPDEALKYAQNAVELAPDTPAYYDTLGWIFYRKALYSEAIRYLKRANSENGDVVWKYHLAMAYAKAGNPSQSKAVLSEALKQNPNVPEAAEARQILSSH